MINVDESAPVLPYQVTVGDPSHSEEDIEDWCMGNLGPRMQLGKGVIWMHKKQNWTFDPCSTWFFRNQEDAVMFEMVWG